MSRTFGSTKRDWILQNQMGLNVFNRIRRQGKNITENSIS